MENKDLNVIIVNDFDYIQGGASKVAIETANLLASKGVNVIFFSGDSSKDSQLNSCVKKICTYQGETLKNRNKIKGAVNGIYNFKAKKQLKILLKTLDRKKTVIHVHGWTKCLSSSIFDVCFKMNYKVVLTMHDYFTACPNGGFFNYRKNRICYLKPMSWKCIKCNCDSRNYFFKIYRLIRQFVQTKIVKLSKKLEYAIIISDFSKNILNKNIPTTTTIFNINNSVEIPQDDLKNDDNNYFLYVGRVCKEKGVELFCQAILESKEHGIIIGDGPEFEYLKCKYHEVEFLGWKNSSTVNRYMKNAKALIFPSKWYETAGLTVVEAALNGTPSIVSNNSAASDFILKYHCGVLFDTDKIHSLVRILKKYNKNDFSFDISKIKKDYNSKIYLAKILNAYDIIVSEMSDNR